MPEVADLGVLSELGTAVGLVDGDGEFEPDWLDDPGSRLGGVLSDDGQRQALLDFCDEVLGDPGRSVDADGRVWLPVLTREEVELCAVIDASAEEIVAIGAGVRLVGSDPDAAGQLQAPVFRVARGAAPRPDSPIFVGRPGARLTASASIRFGEGAEGDAAGLGGIELEFDVPTAADDDDEPAISLTLLDLKLPGGAPGDLRLSPDRAESLDEALLELVLGLVRSQAEAAAGPVEALSRLLGLAGDGPVPSLPLAELLTDAARLGRWLHAVLAERESRRAWLGALADLLGEAASAVEDGVELTIGDARVRVGIDAGADQGGQPLLVPRLALLVGDGPQAVLEAELARIAPAAPAAVALPSLSAFVQLGGERPLLDGDPRVGALRAGVSLDAGRRPTLLLALGGVRVAGTEHDSLDLGSPGALAEAAGTALDGVAAGLLDGLGAVGEALSQLLGLAAPEHHPSLPKIDAARFLGDPVAALREHWLELLREHEAAIPDLLGTARGLLAGAASTAPAEGAGTAEDPWRLPLSDPVELRAVRDPAGALAVSVALSTAAEEIGGGRARVSSEIAVSLAKLDLAAGSADFLGAVDLSLGVRSKAGRGARIDLGDASLRADSIGLAARWSAAAGLEARLDAPNAKLRAGGEEAPAELGAWPTLERLAGLLLALGEHELPAELATALGWLGGDGPRLPLADLAADAQAALGAWLKQAVEQADEEATALAAAAAGLAASLYSTAGRAASAAGSGTAEDPFRLDLGEEAGAPLPLAWVEPAAAAGRAGRLRLGLRLPVRAARGDLVAAGRLDLDLAGFDVSGEKPKPAAGRGLRAVLGVSREGGPLVAGPDPKLDRLDVEVELPLGGDAGEAKTSIVLTGATALGVSADSWKLGAEQPALPEARAALSAALAVLADLAPVAELLSGLGLLAEGGLDAGALEDLLNDPAHLVATALRSRADDLGAAAEALLTDLPGVAVDLAARSVAVDLGPGPSGDGGALAWSARLTATGDGEATATASFGAAGESAAGGFELRLAGAPWQVEAVRHPPGGTPRPIPLWPAADGAALAGLLRDAVPAALARRGLDLLRDADAEARPVLDALLAAIGLLGDDGARFPLGLLADPAGWLAHPGALGGSIDPEKVAALLGALRPVLGAAGSGGRLQPAPGVAIEATASDGAPRLALSLDGEALGGGELAASLAGALTIGDGAPRVELELGAGLAGSATARLRVGGDGGPRLVLQRPDEDELSLYPDPPGAGDLARSGVEAALPALLDAIAARGGKGLDGKAAALLRELGDALALRSDGAFDAASLRALAADPAGELVSRLGELGAAELRPLSAALGEVLPSGARASVAGGRLQLEVAQATLALRPKPFELTIGGEVAEVPALESVAASLRFDASELVELSARVGPGEIDAGGATLRPLLAVAAGAEPEGGRRLDLGLGIDGEDSVRARWDLDAGELALVAVRADEESEEAGAVALAALAALGDLAAGLALGADAVEALLEKEVGGAGKPVRELLAGVLLDADDPRKAIAGLFETDSLLERAMRLAANAVEAEPRLALEGIEVGLGKDDDGRLGLSLAPDGRAPLTSGEVELALEADSRWIDGRPPPGLFLGLLKDGELDPRLACDGLGIRVSRSAGPLLDAGVSLGSLALHLFAAVDADGVAGGVQLELAGLGVAAGGAEGGNSVGQGMLAGARGEGGLEPAFTPALAVQGRRGGPIAVSLSAGEGEGPWWQRIQSSFGPLYVEQVGLGVREREQRLERISLLLDARVSLFGLAAAVDDLSLSFDVSGSKPLFDPAAWSVDLAGLAVAGEVAGVSISGGLRKLEAGKSVEYLGALRGRYSVYGLALFGGYGQAPADGGGRYTSFFAFGALNAPIGGPPAFFVTGIGGGFGVNRGLNVPDDVAEIESFPFVAALDPNSKLDPEPMAALRELDADFPMAEGPFWLAAGVSFNSFALVEGVAVLSVAVDDGLEVALLGLARMALPRPGVALASIELGLIARISTREGVLWVQAQLTDNSWLLNESVRLTGGFAFVTWFAGPRAGEFVVTLGGYHPSFHRDGYPDVPRLGFDWRISDEIVVKGESYFALTSEALMAGGRLEASAHFGPAWAKVVFGADGIVYFDPFHFQVDVYASISAGIRIHVWLLGNVTISIHIGAHVMLEGPKFHGKAHFEVGPVGLTVAFGDETKAEPRYLPWPEFVVKYLEDAGGGVARVLSAVPGRGQLAPGPAADGSDRPQPDGSPQRPFEVLPEFELTVKATAPVARLTLDGDSPESREMPVDHVLGIAPVHATRVESNLRLALEPVAGSDVGSWPQRFEVESLDDGRFPLGVWGPPGEQDAKAVPSGEVLRAGEGARIVAAAQLQGRLPAEVPYERVEADARKPLPLNSEGAERAKLLRAAAPLKAATPAVDSARAALAGARSRLAAGGLGRTALAAYAGERAAPPRLGSLADGLAKKPPRPPKLKPPAPVEPRQVDSSVRPPRALALLVCPAPPEGDGAGPPLTRSYAAALAVVAGLGRGAEARKRLAELSRGLRAKRGAPLRTGELIVLEMPNARRDVDSGAPRPTLRSSAAARFATIGLGGEVLADTLGTEAAIPPATERVAVLAPGAPAERPLLGWHAGQRLAYVGWGTALAAGGTLHVPGGGVSPNRQRLRSGWVEAAELTGSAPVTETRFVEPLRAVAVAVDREQSGGKPQVDLTLSGASRAGDATRVAVGARTYLVYEVKPQGEGPVTVTVAHLDGRPLAGVLGSASAGAAELARQLGRQGVDSLLRPLTGAPAKDEKPLSLRWAAAPRSAKPPKPTQTTRKERR